MYEFWVTIYVNVVQFLKSPSFCDVKSEIMSRLMDSDPCLDDIYEEFPSPELRDIFDGLSVDELMSYISVDFDDIYLDLDATTDFSSDSVAAFSIPCTFAVDEFISDHT